VADAVVLRVERPYSDEDEYLAEEGWTIDEKSIVLVGEADLPKDTVVRFEIVLQDGARPIRAEGKVSRSVAGTATKPGGLKVRFRRFDAATKRFIDRAVAQKKPRRSRKPPAAELAPLVLEPASDPEAASSPESLVASVTSPDPALEESGVRQLRVGPIAAPPNREELLQRLRDRLAKVREREADQEHG
jgi:hypothetical protein